MPTWPRSRVCGSDDSEEAEQDGSCVASRMNYKEVRLLAQDWESSFFATWIVQIILSEILDVPTSVETGDPEMNTDFYNIDSSLDYGLVSPGYEELTKGSARGCQRATTESTNGYLSCADVILEGWREEQAVDDLIRLGGLGAIGITGWWVPRFTALKDASFTTFLGISGESNRRKLAETFKRPTTWRQYCNEVSTNGCVGDDGVAARAPMGIDERDSMFVEGLYTGHFRFTAKNDCDSNPDTCTGHFTDYPCQWQTFFAQQSHHLNIALEGDGSLPNGGYTYSQMNQIWKAANATKSDVMMMYWFPEALGESFIGTDAEFTRVVLPPPTQECVDSRVAASCEEGREAGVGDPEGSCDEPDLGIMKVVSRSFYERSSLSDTSNALRSPAYEAIAKFEITGLQYGQIFSDWFNHDTGNANFDLRNATCRWVVENFETIMSFVPESYPRTIKAEGTQGSVLFVFSVGVACVAIVSVAASIVATSLKKKTRTLYYTQVQFVYIILSGMLLVALGGLVLTIPPTDASCVASVWLTNVGYALQLVPLAMRIYEISKVVNSGQHMQRVRMRVTSLVQTVAIFSFLVIIFLSTWTALDPPRKDQHFELTTSTTMNEETIIKETDFCGSDSDAWMFLSTSWQGLLLFPALTVAIMASRAVDDVNDTSTLAMVVGVHLVFVAMRVLAFALADDDSRSESMLYISLFLSADTIISICVQILPKFLFSGEDAESKLLPDLFLNTTVMLADISGFTAWSSVREPMQVFKLLEAVFENFDVIAERHKIFKVETTGERYVAASGIPDHRPDHAVVMARFATDCMKKMDVLTKKLEVRFGPDTCDLALRIGIHSGAVTGGFMKGKHSHFQLFGDTMTTASLIHETGKSQKIHLSEQTADLLTDAGRKAWIAPREKGISTVEKGDLRTHWLLVGRERDDPEASSRSSNQGSYGSGSIGVEVDVLDTEQRRVEWVVEMMRVLLKKIVARRHSHGTTWQLQPPTDDEHSNIPLDDVQQVLDLPRFDTNATRRQQTHQAAAEIPNAVVDELREYVTRVARLYKNHSFHNFAHASYMVMAVTKYMHRMVAASEADVGVDEDHRRSSTREALHDHTYGITGDPLTEFACVFSALIHDVDHPGIPNSLLIEEDREIGDIYRFRCVAEQKSFDLSWMLFLKPAFDNLRATICSDHDELVRFRQIVVNCTMATDLFDEELQAQRRHRWSKAFGEGHFDEKDPSTTTNGKATVVIEYLIQAADVAHTCQHWKVYQRWNQKLFEETHEAFRQGRAKENPATYWYEGELFFFDEVVIPLSRRLRDSGVFGATSDENLNFAESNRAIWERDGNSIVAEMLKKVEGSDDDDESSHG